MFFLLKFFIYFPVYFDILQATMQDNHDFGVDRPVVKVWNESFVYEFERGSWLDFVLMFSIHAFK